MLRPASLQGTSHRLTSYYMLATYIPVYITETATNALFGFFQSFLLLHNYAKAPEPPSLAQRVLGLLEYKIVSF